MLGAEPPDIRTFPLPVTLIVPNVPLAMLIFPSPLLIVGVTPLVVTPASTVK